MLRLQNRYSKTVNRNNSRKGIEFSSVYLGFTNWTQKQRRSSECNKSNSKLCVLIRFRRCNLYLRGIKLHSTNAIMSVCIHRHPIDMTVCFRLCVYGFEFSFVFILSKKYGILIYDLISITCFATGISRVFFGRVQYCEQETISSSVTTAVFEHFT